MINQGRKKIGTISYTLATTGEERRSAFLDSMAEFNMPVNARHCLDLSDCWNEAYDAAKKLLADKRNRPDALICFNDYVANDVLNAALDLGIQVPEELALVGFGNLPLTLRTRPRLATVDQYPCEIGRRAATLLLDRITGKETGTRQDIAIPTTFIVRESIQFKNTTTEETI